MISFRPFLLRTLASFAAIALAASCSTARAQGRDLIDDDNDVEIEDAVDALRLPRVAGIAVQFDFLVYGREGAEESRRRLAFRLKSRIAQIDRACTLTKEQRNKLAVAGRVDITRTFTRLDELKKQYSVALKDARKQRQVLEEIVPFRKVMAEMDCFGEGSLFSKILKSNLSPQQVASQDKAAKDARMAQHRATVAWVVRSVDTWLLLKPEQHQKLEDLLLAETRPPRKWGEYDYYGLMCQAARLSEKKLKPIFNDDQWRKIQTQLAEALRIEKMLRIEGFLPDEDVADAGKTRRNDPIPEQEEPRC